ncbi:MAG: hypothetical protein QW472_04830 [Candidatus Aenigmatarchaeota archaeon]
MHIIEIIDFYRKGVKPNEINYIFVPSIIVPYKSKVIADVDSNQIEINFPRTSVTGMPNSLAEEFEQVWVKIKKTNPKLTNSIIANLQKLRYTNGELQWQENLTDFKTLSGLRLGIFAKLEEELQDNLLAQLAPTSPGAVVETSDDKLILGVRGKKVHLDGKIMPFPVGHPRYIFHRNPSQNYLENPLQSLARQAITEMNLPLYSPDMNRVYGVAKEILLIGVVRDRGTTENPSGSWNPLPTFFIKTKWDAELCRRGYESAVDKYEHERFLTIHADETALSKTIEEFYPRFVGNGLGELLIYGRFRFGDKWYEKCILKLVKKYKARIKEGNPFL